MGEERELQSKILTTGSLVRVYSTFYNFVLEILLQVEVIL